MTDKEFNEIKKIFADIDKKLDKILAELKVMRGKVLIDDIDQ